MAFHPYPQLIRRVFNLSRFGPPPRFTEASPWPWIDHPASGLLHATRRPVRTRFRFGYTCNGLTLLRRATRRLIMQKVRGHPEPFRVQRAPTACRRTVSGTISLPALGCFSPFPHGTSSLSVMYEYLGLEGGPPMFRQDFTCPALLESFSITFAYGAVTRYGHSFQSVLLVEDEALAWSAFARHY